MIKAIDPETNVLDNAMLEVGDFVGVRTQTYINYKPYKRLVIPYKIVHITDNGFVLSNSTTISKQDILYNFTEQDKIAYDNYILRERVKSALHHLEIAERQQRPYEMSDIATENLFAVLTQALSIIETNTGTI